MRKAFLIISLTIIIAVGSIIAWLPYLWWIIVVILPFLILGWIDYSQKSDNIQRNYPLIGRITNFMEQQRHVLQEALLLNRSEGMPFNWIQKEIVYKRAADNNKSQPFGTQLSFEKLGREWFLHSAFPSIKFQDDFRVTIGGPKCNQPYSASILNLGGMSYGSISKNATLALNGGAKIAGFAQNTGEGGLTPYHQEYGADLIFQFGTGYFGCRNAEGNFDAEKFTEIAQNDLVKMIEIKISQGAKPGFGAILPAKKNTEEISKFREIEAHTEIHSPAHHSAFNNSQELIKFIDELRELSSGKPIGIKLCLGQQKEFQKMIKVFAEMQSYPDFIVIDGAEGGSGAANMDSLHWGGTPLQEALHFVNKTLVAFHLKQHIKILASGKIISAFDIYKTLALGADACYSARGMMFALGCVQSLKCNLNTCPTGITTMDPGRVDSLSVVDKKAKVANYHRNTIGGLKEILVAMGLKDKNGINKGNIFKKVEGKSKSYEEIYK